MNKHMSSLKLAPMFWQDAAIAGLSPEAISAVIICASWSASWNKGGEIPKKVFPALTQRFLLSRRARERVLEELLTSMWRGPMFTEQGESYFVNPQLFSFSRDGADWDRSCARSVMARDGHRCRYCGTLCDGDLTIDHVFPKSRGGSDDVENLVVACRSCNSKKHDRTPAEAGMRLLPVPSHAVEEKA